MKKLVIKAKLPKKDAFTWPADKRCPRGSIRNKKTGKWTVGHGTKDQSTHSHINKRSDFLLFSITLIIR